MAWYEDNSFGEYYAEGISDFDQSEVLNDILFGNHGARLIDHHAEDLFISSVFDKNKEAYFDLIDYVWDKFGINFEDAFDFEEFKSWYDAQ